jgi:hypothetical protein
LSLRQWLLLGALCHEGRLRDGVPTAEVVRRVYGETALADYDRRRALEQVRRRPRPNSTPPASGSSST